MHRVLSIGIIVMMTETMMTIIVNSLPKSGEQKMAELSLSSLGGAIPTWTIAFSPSDGTSSSTDLKEFVRGNNSCKGRKKN